MLIKCDAAATDALPHILRAIPSVIMFTLLLLYIVSNFLQQATGLCGDSIKWSHRVNLDEVYGVWYGVGYAQHNPDMTNLPNEVGCVTLYIIDATYEYGDNWVDWSVSI